MREISIQVLAMEFVKNRDDLSFAKIIKRLRPGLIGFVYNYVKDNDLALEIVSQVFVNVWEKVDQYNTNYNFSTWVYAIAKNEALGTLRQRKKLLSHEKLEENNSRILKIYSPIVNMEMEVMGPTGDEIVDQLHAKVLEEIDNLDEPYRSVMIEREILQKQLQDISDSLDWNLSTVKTRLRKARRDIAENVRKKYPMLVDAYNNEV